MVEQLFGTPIETRQVGTALVAVPVDRALLQSATWQALRAGPRSGVGRTLEEALLLLAHAAGRVAGDSRARAAPRAADRWLYDRLQGAAGPVLASEVGEAARRAGIGPTALRRASRRLGVVRSKVGLRGGWTWRLPDADTDAISLLQSGPSTDSEWQHRHQHGCGTNDPSEAAQAQPQPDTGAQR